MGNLQDEFKKEFRKEVGVYGSKDIYSMPLPKGCGTWEVSGSDMFLVKGIDDKYYGKLNDTYVKRLPRGTVARRRKIDRATRGFKVDDKGSYVYEEVQVPGKSIVVVSRVMLGLPYKYEVEGFGYIDFIENKEKGYTEYLYIVKKENLYKVNQTALAISVKNMKNYSGMGYVTWMSGVVYLHIIPYRPNSMYVGSKILKTGVSLDFGKEIREIVNFWKIKGIIPDVKLCAVDDGNLAMKPTEVGYTDYVPHDVLSLGDIEIYGSDVN